jgi:hypothetical protein
LTGKDAMPNSPVRRICARTPVPGGDAGLGVHARRDPGPQEGTSPWHAMVASISTGEAGVGCGAVGIEDYQDGC